MEVMINNTKLTLIRGDITQQDTEAIVNAANSSLLGGGGVDGAIHRAGGPAILEECKKIRKEKGECPTGEAVITTGGKLKAKYVIHAVGPIWRGGNNREEELLASAYRNSMRIAQENEIKTISFPSISTGAYRFPIDKAAKIALSTVIECIKNGEFKEVRFVLFTEQDLQTYEKVLKKILNS